MNLINNAFLKFTKACGNVNKLPCRRNKKSHSPFKCVSTSALKENTESVSSFTRNCNQKQLFRVRCGILLRRNEQDCNTVFLALFCKLKATKNLKKDKTVQEKLKVPYNLSEMFCYNFLQFLNVPSFCSMFIHFINYFF